MQTWNLQTGRSFFSTEPRPSKTPVPIVRCPGYAGRPMHMSTDLLDTSAGDDAIARPGKPKSLQKSPTFVKLSNENSEPNRRGCDVKLGL